VAGKGTRRACSLMDWWSCRFVPRCRFASRSESLPQVEPTACREDFFEPDRLPDICSRQMRGGSSPVRNRSVTNALSTCLSNHLGTAGSATVGTSRENSCFARWRPKRTTSPTFFCKRTPLRSSSVGVAWSFAERITSPPRRMGRPI